MVGKAEQNRTMLNKKNCSSKRMFLGILHVYCMSMAEKADSAKLDFDYGPAKLYFVYCPAEHDVDLVLGPAKLDFAHDPAKLDFVYGPTKLDFIYGPAKHDVNLILGPAKLDFIYSPVKLDFVYGPAKLDFVNDPPSSNSSTIPPS